MGKCKYETGIIMQHMVLKVNIIVLILKLKLK
jgi:hypothetical protein